VSLQDINEERFAIAGLYGKLANTFADLKSDRLTTTGNFKMLVSGDFIRAQKRVWSAVRVFELRQINFSAQTKFRKQMIKRLPITGDG